MKNAHIGLICPAALAVSMVLAATVAEAEGPSSSLFGNPDQRQPLVLSRYSPTYRPPPEVKSFGLNDLVTIIVDESSMVISEGEMDRKKKAHGDLILENWILLKGLAAVPDPQIFGDPHISGAVDNKMRSEAAFESRDSMKFKIACRVADIRPNGNLILEGRRTIRNNQDSWEYALTGEVRSDDVLPNNTVLSENLADLWIQKRESGHVRNGYRRGWLLRWLDKWQPF